MSRLTTFRDHARAMADDDRVPENERALWEQLATEVDGYLADDQEQA